MSRTKRERQGGIVLFAGLDANTTAPTHGGLYTVPAAGGTISTVIDYHTTAPESVYPFMVANANNQITQGVISGDYDLENGLLAFHAITDGDSQGGQRRRHLHRPPRRHRVDAPRQPSERRHRAALPGQPILFRRTAPVTAVSLPTVTLAASVPGVVVGSGQIGEFTLSLPAAQATDLVINLAIKGTAVNGTDYVLLKTSKKIKAGKTSKAIKIIPQGDLGGAGKKVVVLELVEGNGYTVGTAGKVKVKIFDPAN